MNILFIGPLPPPIGGATVSFRQLTQEVKQQSSIRSYVINTSRKDENSPAKGIIKAVSVSIQILLNIWRADVVSFHASCRGSLLLGPIIFILCTIFRKPWIFRGFGGNYADWHKSLNTVSRNIFNHTILKANVLLFQTKYSVNYFENETQSKVRWYSNSRNYEKTADSVTINPSQKARKFIFIGHVKPSKGVLDIIKAADILQNQELSIECFGPLKEGLSADLFNQTSVRYQGVLQPEAVSAALANSDVLLLPTYYDGEGYPGVILEAYGLGIPVIVTQWKALPEIVDTSCGIFVEPKSPEQLAKAMQSIASNETNYANLRKGAIEKSKVFSSKHWTQVFLDICSELYKA